MLSPSYEDRDIHVVVPVTESKRNVGSEQLWQTSNLVMDSVEGHHEHRFGFSCFQALVGKAK